jgi:hypothetical protein
MKLWHKLAKLPFGWRLLVKLLILAFVVLAVLFPHPVILVRELQHLRNPDALIQPDLPALKEISLEIDRLLATNTAPQAEFKVVERFVYQKIRYQYDWYNWGNLDYWPTAAEVWEKKKEDCDGRAVLAASILRARGHKDVRLVANVNHVWVAVGTNELMGPQADKNFQRVDGKVKLTLPKFKTLMDTLAMVCKFPVPRSLILFFTAVVLLYHPCLHLGGFFLTSTVGLSGLMLLLNWGELYLNRDADNLTVNLLCALGLLVLAAVLAKFMPRWLRMWQGRRGRAASAA